MKVSSSFTCRACGLQFVSSELQRGHFKSAFHLLNLKRSLAKLDPIPKDTFDAILEQKRMREMQNEPQIRVPAQQSKEDSELARMNEPERLCLCCDHISSSLESNVTHMTNAHSVHFPQPLDHDSLTEYLKNENTPSVNCCLFCRKNFRSRSAVIQHMEERAHQKFDNYDFDALYLADTMQLDTTTLEMNENCELVLPSGKKVVHRELAVFSKQKERNTIREDSEETDQPVDGEEESSKALVARGRGDLSYASLPRPVKAQARRAARDAETARLQVGIKQNAFRVHFVGLLKH
eukprot:TRINITY_DN2427_c0_g1_i1.p1 TRINITY_DN2427_c0_g1~~TRINITY_DN2427_c0_g1_i1.p1  ORF type:complete len:293 (-),score=39.70 TRINITY_DN2427_c0_g1_i1:51-929(-)